MSDPTTWQPSAYVHQRQYDRMDTRWVEERKAEESLLMRGPGRLGSPECNVVAAFRTQGDRDACVDALSELVRTRNERDDLREALTEMLEAHSLNASYGLEPSKRRIAARENARITLANLKKTDGE